MPPNQIKTAVVSVDDKRNLEVLAKGLYENVVTIYATSGTADRIRAYSPVEIPTEFSRSFRKLRFEASNGCYIGLGLEPSEGTNIDLIVWNLVEFGEILRKPFREVVGKVVKGQRMRSAEDYMDIAGLDVITTAVYQYWKGCITLVNPDDYQLVVDDIKRYGFISDKVRIELFSHAKEYIELVNGEFEMIIEDVVSRESGRFRDLLR